MTFINVKPNATHDALLRDAFEKVKEELTEHLEAINQNTVEVAANYEYLSSLEEKIEKLADKIDQVYLLLEDRKPQEQKPTFTQRETELLEVLRAQKEISVVKLSQHIGLPPMLIEDLAQSIQQKGIPLLKEELVGDTLLKLHHGSYS
jgi:predicted transcriptional regulator